MDGCGVCAIYSTLNHHPSNAGLRLGNLQESCSTDSGLVGIYLFLQNYSEKIQFSCAEMIKLPSREVNIAHFPRQLGRGVFL